MNSRRFTVMQVLPALEGGGVERGTLEVADELVRRGHRSLVVSAGGRLVDPLTAAGSEHFCYPVGEKSPLTARLIPVLRSLMLSQQVDVVHVRSRVPAWVAWLAWKSIPASRRPRLITTVHGQYSPNGFSRIMTRGEVVVAVSETIREYICRHYPDVPESSIRLIHRGADPHEFPRGFQPSETWLDEWRAAFPQLINRQVLTIAGRLTRLKGHLDFLELMSRLRRDGRLVHGLIVGGEDPRRQQYAAELRQRVHELGLAGFVTLTGHRSDVREIYSVSDLVLSLSTKPESFGRTVAEALSLGRPVVGYDHGGVGEILRTAFPAGAVTPGEADALAARVGQMLDHCPPVPPLDAFHLQTMLDKTLDLYAELTDRRAAA